MASTNFKIFNEEMSSDRTYSDSEYSVATQRQGGVIPGMALSRLHNKMYRQSTAMAKAIADFLVVQGFDCMDNDVPAITAGVQSAILNIASGKASSEIEAHNTSIDAHANLLQLRKNSTAYVIGDVKHSLTLPSWARLECTQAGTTAATEPPWPGVGEETTDGTCKWRIGDVRGSGMPIGSIMPLLSQTPLPGFLALAGQSVARATYPQLWAYIQTTGLLKTESEWQAQAAVQSSVGYYSSGDGSTTFRLPKIVDYLRGSDAGRDPGTWLDDMFKSHIHTTDVGTMFIAASGSAQRGAGGGVNTGATGGTETRPKTINALYCIKAFDAPTNQGMIDITALANEMANKVNKTEYTADFAKSFGANGYQKLPSGLIIQWGAIDISNSDILNVFPITFPNVCFKVIACNGYTAGSGSVGYVVTGGYTKTTFVSRGNSATLGGQYIAIGY